MSSPTITEGLHDEQWTHGTVRANGIELHYVEQGEGPLLLLLHGFPEFWYSWRHQLRAFSDRFRVVAPDLRGYNLSDKPDGRRAYTLDVLVADVRDMITSLGHDTCVLAGHDWGGAVAWQFAYTHPEMLDALMALNLPHPVRFYEGLGTLSQLRRSWYIFLFQLPWLPEKILSRKRFRPISGVFATQAKNPDAFSQEDLEAYREAAARPGALTAMLNYYRALLLQAPRFAKDDYGVLDVPTLMIWGEDDVALGKELTYQTDRLVNDLRIEYIPDCSHWVQQDRPQTVNRLMSSFLEELEPL